MLQSGRVAEAEVLMGERRYSEAIAAFEAHVSAEPQDLRALLKLGICHLLNCSREAFLEVYHRAEDLITRIGAVPSNVADLYELYRSLIVRVGAASLVAGTLVFNQGCTGGAPGGGGTPSISGKADAGSPIDYRPQHRYSGGVSFDKK